MNNVKMKEIIKIGALTIALIAVLFLFCFYAINKQKQRTVKEMANKILSSAEYYAIGQIMDNDVHDVIINFPDNHILDIRGNLPKSGYVKITSDSKIEILFHYNGYCVSKGLNDIDNKFKKISKKECLNNTEDK